MYIHMYICHMFGSADDASQPDVSEEPAQEVCVCLCVCVHMFIDMYMCIYVYIYIIYIYIYIYRPTRAMKFRVYPPFTARGLVSICIYPSIDRWMDG